MASVTIDIDPYEILEDIDDKTFLRELVRRLEKRSLGWPLSIEARRAIEGVRRCAGFEPFGGDAPKDLLPNCDRAYLEWKQGRR